MKQANIQCASWNGISLSYLPYIKRKFYEIKNWAGLQTKAISHKMFKIGIKWKLLRI